MIRLFKILGLLFLLFSASLCGFLAAFRLKCRRDRLQAICSSMSSLRDRIRLNEGEIEKLLALSFGEDYTRQSPGRYCLDERYLNREEIELLECFFREIGMSDAQAEGERIARFIELFAARRDRAAEEYREQGKLYRTVGVLGGLFLCIFFL